MGLPEEYVPRIEETDLKRNRSGYWEITWTVPASVCGTPRGRSKSRTTGTKDFNLASKIRRDYLASLVQALAGISLPTIRELVGKYEADHVAMNGTAPTQMQSLKPVVHFLGDLTPDALTAAEQSDYRAKRGQGRAAGFGRGPAAPGTIRRELGALNAVLGWAVKKGHLPRDFHLPDIDLPPEGQAREVHLDKETERDFYRHCERTFRRTRVTGSPAEQMSRKHLVRAALFAMIALSTWARAKAIEGLTWDRVDLKRKLIDYRDTSLRRSKKRRVPVPIEDRLWRNLARQWIRQGKPKVGLVLGTRGEMRKSFARLKATFAGVLPADLTRHALRHTGATLAAMDDVPMGKIAQMLGDTLETTEKHYVHYSPSYLRDVVNRGRG